MAVVKMEKAFIFSPRNFREAVVRDLHKLGMVQITGTPMALEAVDPKGAEESINKIQFLLNFIPPHKKEKRGFIQDMMCAKDLVSETEFENSISGFEWEYIFSRCVAINKELEEIKKKRESYQHTIKELEPWAGFNLSLNEIKGTKSTFVILGRVRIEVYPWLFGELSAKSDNFILREVKDTEKDRYFILVGLREENNIGSSGVFTPILKKFNYSNIILPAEEDNPSESISKIKKELTALYNREKMLLDEKNNFSEKRQNLINLHDYYLWEKDKVTIQKHFGKTEKTIIIEGWIKANDTESLKKHLATLSNEIYVDFRSPQEGEDVPTALKNNPIFRPFELIIELYGMPNYREKDPTPLIAIFFSIIFGFALGDVVYGLALALVSTHFAKKYKITESDKKVFGLFFWVGITTIFIGAMTGTWMGDLPEVLNKLSGSLGIFKKVKDSLMIIDPLNQLIPFIAIALSVGVIHVFTGLGFKAYQNILNGKVVDAVFDQIVWIILVSSLILMGVVKANVIPNNLYPIFSWSAKISALLILFFSNRDTKNIFARVGLGAWKLYGISAYVGDILSYVRLVALGLASSIIAMVFNIIAFLPSNPFAKAITILICFAGGHIFNLIIGMLGAFVHTARLHYVEFFGKFYDNGGKPFRPFRKEGKYIIVE
ncbi:MAG: V-type ATP synthase subunit I [bacterium]